MLGWLWFTEPLLSGWGSEFRKVKERSPGRGAALFFNAFSSLEPYGNAMALVRILVDGYSLLHNWPELARGRPRYSAAARDALIRQLTAYQDAIGTPITVVFDGISLQPGTEAAHSGTGVEVLFSRSGQTADQMIERAAHRLAAYGQVLAVTDDLAERQTVLSLGGLASSCWNFIQSVQSALSDLRDEIKDRNRQERHRFGR
jgi:uncharacterized protein